LRSVDAAHWWLLGLGSNGIVGHDTEYDGKTGLLMERWKRSLGELTRGKGLALKIGVVTLVVAGGIHYFAGGRGTCIGSERIGGSTGRGERG
jgi:hypothetical protein